MVKPEGIKLNPIHTYCIYQIDLGLLYPISSFILKQIRAFPSNLLKNYVKSYWYLEIEPADIPFQQIYFPYGAHELIFYIHNPTEMAWLKEDRFFLQPTSFFSGQFSQPFKMSFTKPSICIGASLYPWAGKNLFSHPADEFQNVMVPLSILDKNAAIAEELTEYRFSVADMFQLLDKYLVSKLDKWALDPLSKQLIQIFTEKPSLSDHKGLVSSLGLSRRRIEQRFKESVGLTMGFYSRKLKFQKSIALIKQGHLSIAQVGLEAGYYDQSHFISEFKEFSNTTPLEYRQNQSTILSFLSGSDLFNKKGLAT